MSSMVPIETILRSYNVDFIREGANVAPGNINIRCPFCGIADPSYHMGIQLKSGKWGCWRMPNHRGKDFKYLLSVILRLPMEVIGDLVVVPTANELREATQKLLPVPTVKPTPERVLQWPEGERSLLTLSPVGERFRSYMRARGFTDLECIAKEYDIRIAITGRFNNRILFPVKNEWGELIGWTGRAISYKAIQRYLSHPQGSTIKENLLFFDQAIHNPFNSDTLIIVEGPFDALNVSYKTRDLGCGAVALFGNSATNSQITKLTRLTKLYQRVIILLDPDAWAAAMRLKQALSFMDNVRIKLVEHHDPGSMGVEELKEIIGG